MLNILNTVLFVSVFGGLLMTFAAYRRFTASTKSEWDKELEAEGAKKAKVVAELERLKKTEKDVREKELMLANLYEITKEMSSALSFWELWGVFGPFLQKHFIFTRAELIILKGLETGYDVNARYKINGENYSGDGAGEIDHNEWIKLFLEDTKGAYLTREKDAPTFQRLGISETVRTLASIPLLSERKLVGILVVEDLPFIHFERLVIVAMQFSMEIKKVLLYEIVEELAITDSLTGLYVRRHFFERYKEELQRSKRYNFTFAFLMIDIDDFKRCNDTYGHLVGDAVLKEMAQTIRQSVREIDLVGRYGGEEFAILLPETRREGALLAAERIRERIESGIFTAYDERLKATVSIGIAIYPDDGDNPAGIVEKADQALYEAKHRGKNIVCMYEK